MSPLRISKFFITMSVCLLIILLNITMLRFIPSFIDYGDNESVMGGKLYNDDYEGLEPYIQDRKRPADEYIERFLRPSLEKTVEQKYSFGSEGTALPESFILPSEAVRAYFDILSDASSMGDKRGGCGSIGFGSSPYPAAYDLLAEGFKGKLPFEKFLKSFEGIGHINLLKLIEAPAVKMDGSIHPRFFVEIETIEGSDTMDKTFFAYYYGYVTAGREEAKGWKISGIELKPEDFLCHAYHGWWHDAGTIVEVVYNKKCGVIDKILNVEEDGCLRNVFAKDMNGRQYRFVFVRLSNGADVELRQFVLEDGKWKDIYIDKDKCKDE